AHEALGKVFLNPAPGHAVEAGLMAASVAVGFFGILLAAFLFERHPEYPARMKEALAFPHRVLLNKYYVDEVYNGLFVRGAAIGGGTAGWAFDRYVIDGGDGEVRPGLGVNGLAWATRDVIARASNFWDRV